MTRRQWTGLAGVTFGVLMVGGIMMSGTTPESTGAGAAERYVDYWSDDGNQSSAATGTIVLTYAWVLLVCFAAGLRDQLRRGDDGPLPSLAMGAGVASAAVFAVGGVLINAPGVASAENAYSVDGDTALLLEAVGYYSLATAVMLGAAMAVSFALSNRRVKVVPGWTIALAGLLALATVASIFTAWMGFMLLPLWAVVVGVSLLVSRGADAGDVSTL